MNRNLNILGNDIKFDLIEGLLYVSTKDSSDRVCIYSNSADKLVAFNVYSDSKQNGIIRLGLLSDKAVYINDLDDLDQINWNSFDPKPWKSYILPNDTSTLKPNLISLDNYSIVVSFGANDNDSVYYSLDTVDNPRWERHSLPQSSHSIVAMVIGKIYKTRGVFLLYKLHDEDSASVRFQTFTSPKSSRVLRYAFDIKGVAKNIFAANGEVCDTLYVVSDNEITRFTDPYTLTTASQAEVAHKIIDGDVICLNKIHSLFDVQIKEITVGSDRKKSCSCSYRTDLFPTVSFLFNFSNDDASAMHGNLSVVDTISNDSDYQVVKAGDSLIILSSLNELILGDALKAIKIDLIGVDLVIFARNVSLVGKISARSIKIFAYNIITNATRSDAISDEIHGIKHKIFQSEVALSLPTDGRVLELYDFFTKTYTSVKIQQVSDGVYDVTQEISLVRILDNIMFFHPAQGSMLLEKAKLLYQTINPADHNAVKPLAALLVVITDLSKMFQKLGNDSPLKELYDEHEASIGAKNSIEMFKSIYNSALGLISQLQSGSDYYGNAQNYVPSLSFNAYSEVLQQQINNFEFIEKGFNAFTDKNTTQEKKRQELKDAIEYLKGLASLASNQITDLKKAALDTEKEIQSFESQFDKKSSDVDAKLKRFKNDLNNDFSLDIRTILGAITTIAFLSENPVGWIVGVGEIANSIAESAEVVKNDNNIPIQKKYILNKLKVFEEEINTKNLAEASKKLDDGTISIKDDSTQKLIVEKNKLDSFLEDFCVKFPESTKTLKESFQDYINIVLERNNRIVHYNAIIALIVKSYNTIKNSDSQSELLSIKSIQGYQPNLPIFATLMQSLYNTAKAQVMEILYLTERSFLFWSLSDHKPVTNLFSGKAIPGINTQILKSAQSEICSAYTKVLEKFTSDAQVFPRKDSDPGIIWDLTSDQVDSLKEDGSIIFKIPSVSNDTKIDDNKFAGLANIRIIRARVYLNGAQTTNGEIRVYITHTGKEEIIDSDSNSFTFNHHSTTVQFRYGTKDKNDAKILDDGNLVYKYENGKNTYALFGPFTFWKISVPFLYNQDLNLKDLQGVSIHFHITHYSFTI